MLRQAIGELRGEHGWAGAPVAAIASSIAASVRGDGAPSRPRRDRGAGVPTSRFVAGLARALRGKKVAYKRAYAALPSLQGAIVESQELRGPNM